MHMNGLLDNIELERLTMGMKPGNQQTFASSVNWTIKQPTGYEILGETVRAVCQTETEYYTFANIV